MKVVAVVLNWNGGDDTIAALDSLAGVPAICVDNGSTDGSDDVVAERLPEVELVRTGANLGFAAFSTPRLRMRRVTSASPGATTWAFAGRSSGAPTGCCC